MAKTRDRIIEDGDKARTDNIIRGNVNRQVERAPTFVSVYANDVQLQTSPWDLRLTFGMMHVGSRPDGSEPTAHVLEVADVRLSPQLAKRVATIMGQQLDAYESRFGSIPQPPED